MSAAEMDAVARVLGHAAAAAQPGRWSANRRRSLQRNAASPFLRARACCIAPLDGVGRDYPLSIEKLCPVLSFYVVKDWREGCERCKQILRYGGMGHTMSIHSQNEPVILEFGLRKPAFRICVNTPTTHGSIGLTTGLDPAMTLGCGGYGGNITSDNISPRHLLNIKRLAYEIRPAVSRFDADVVRPTAAAANGLGTPGIKERIRRVPGNARLQAGIAAGSRATSHTYLPAACDRFPVGVARSRAGTRVASARFCLRRRRAARDPCGTKTDRVGTRNRDTCGARPCGTAPRIHDGVGRFSRYC